MTRVEPAHYCPPGAPPLQAGGGPVHQSSEGATWPIHTEPRAPFAPWDRRELPGAFDVEESARRVGNYKWAEMKLFEALGGWVATVPELDVKMRLGTHCYNHAWHAELWHKRLPELREMNPERLTQPANDAMVAFVDAMTEPEAPELTIEKLVGVYRVLIPHFIAAYTYHLNNTSQITDAPTIRSLNFILQDEFDDWRDGEMLIQSLIETPEEVDRAAAHQARLEKLMRRGRRHRRARHRSARRHEATRVSVSVTPQQFTFVAFDAGVIQRIAEDLLRSLGLEGRDVTIEVDETTPLARTACRRR